MRIALVSLHTSPLATPGSGDAGGMNVVVAEAARALAELGHEVHAVTRATLEVPAGTSDLGSGALLTAIAAGPDELRKEHLPAIIPEFAHGMRALGNFDAVHAHYWLSGVAAHAAFPDRGRAFATTFHTFAAHKNDHLAAGDRPEPETRVRAERELAAQSYVIAGSASELAAVTRYAGTPPVGASVVRPGVDTSLFTPGPAHGHVGDERAGDPLSPLLRVTVLGRVQPLKGQELAVRTLLELRALDPDLAARTELVAAGEPTPGAEAYARGLRDLVAAAGAESLVRFLPAQSRAEAATLLAQSDVVLVPSHSETFGLTALEAAASGVPVIAAGHTGLLEAVPPGAGAIHMAQRDPRAWATTLAELLRDPARRHALGAAARAHALTHNWRAHAHALEGVYAELAS